MSWFVLDIINSTLFSDIAAQIDQCLMMSGDGSPVGTVAAAKQGIRYIDTETKIIYVCTETDGSDDVEETTWQIQCQGNAIGEHISTNTSLTPASGKARTVSGSPTIELPESSTALNGLEFQFKNIGTGTVNFTVDGGGTIDNLETYPFSLQFGLVGFKIVDGAWYAF